MTSTTELHCQKLYRAIMSNYKNLMLDVYAGKDGCKRLAREYGVALRDIHDPKQRHNEITSSYGVLCVRAYLLKPPIDAKEWAKEINSVLEGAK